MKRIACLAVALLSAATLAGVSALNAAAFNAEFNSEGGKVETTTTQKFSVGTSGSYSCKKLTFEYAKEKGKTLIAQKPTYSQCRDEAGYTVTITNMKCAYRFEALVEHSAGPPITAESKASIVAESGSSCEFKIEDTTLGCTFGLKNGSANEKLTDMVFDNIKEVAPFEGTAEAKLHGITYTVNKGCPGFTPPGGTNMEYRGNFEAKGVKVE